MMGDDNDGDDGAHNDADDGDYDQMMLMMVDAERCT